MLNFELLTRNIGGATMKCPTCGAENEAANRFCEQCGSRIEPSGGFPQAQVALAAQPTAAGPTMFAPPVANAAAPAAGEPTVICAACGQPNLATDRFCDHCGAALAAAP